MEYYYRADLSSPIESSYPIIAAIDSVEELQAYYENNKEIYQFHVGYYSEESMADAVFNHKTRYDDVFFEEGFLLFVIVEEGSGSVKHRVDSVKPENGLLSVNITRIVPEIGTADMAQWHIVLEQNRCFAGMDVAIIISDEYLSE